MIVRNEAHIVREVLDAVAPYISYWVIVDTGSNDGTQDVVRDHMSGLGIPGELHERPWHDFGRNRSEALTLARGHGDYIWIIDADDTVVGTIDFSRLHADVYALRYGDAGFNYWRAQLVRDGLPWSYGGVVHEYLVCDAPISEANLEGDYYIDSRRLGSRNLDRDKYARDRDLLLAEIERNPDDARSAFYLAQSYFDLGDFAAARHWYARRAEMGGWPEETYNAMYRVGWSLAKLDAPLQDVQDAFMRAWEFRPSRAEALYRIAILYRLADRHLPAYLFASCAAAIPFCPEDVLFVESDVYRWRAVNEQAVAASWIGLYHESLMLYRRLLARADLPEEDRSRILCNRDLLFPKLLPEAVSYPQEIVAGLCDADRDGDVTVSVVAGPDRAAVERTLNSFLRSSLDLPRIGRFLVADAGLSDEDRETLRQAYGFLEFVDLRDAVADGRSAAPTRVLAEVAGRFWLTIDAGWVFFAPERLVSRLTAVLEAEPGICQVGVNYRDVSVLTGEGATEGEVRRADLAGRYVITAAVTRGPAMFDVTRLAGLLPAGDSDGDVVTALQRQSGLPNATLDEVLCVADPGGAV